MIDNNERIAEIKRRLTQQLKPTKLEVIDDSHLHAGHEGAKTGKGHFTVIISAGTLAGKNKVQQHRMIYSALGDLFETDIHALKIITP